MTKTEAQTRSELIDQQLASAGWNVKDPTQVVEEFDILIAPRNGVAEPRTPYEGHQFSDYVLLGKDRKPLAVIEAKKTSRDAAIGREQAKQYCYNIQKQLGGELPFCFYTNGHDLYFWDLENAPPRKVVGFPIRTAIAAEHSCRSQLDAEGPQRVDSVRSRRVGPDIGSRSAVESGNSQPDGHQSPEHEGELDGPLALRPATACFTAPSAPTRRSLPP